jgi:hypothetical protein
VKIIDIKSERLRVYTFSDYEIRIDGPETLYITENGGHRVQDTVGWVYYIPKNWIGLKWMPRKGCPPVVA